MRLEVGREYSLLICVSILSASLIVDQLPGATSIQATSRLCGRFDILRLLQVGLARGSSD